MSFPVKLQSDGSIDCYKAELVAQGYKQKYQTDYEAPVAKMTTVRVIVALSAISMDHIPNEPYYIGAFTMICLYLYITTGSLVLVHAGQYK